MCTFMQLFVCLAVWESHGCEEKFAYSHEFLVRDIASYLNSSFKSVPLDLVRN